MSDNSRSIYDALGASCLSRIPFTHQNERKPPETPQSKDQRGTPYRRGGGERLAAEEKTNACDGDSRSFLLFHIDKSV